MIGDGDLDAIFANGDFDEEAVFTITPAAPPDPAVTLTIRGWFTPRTDATLFFGQVGVESAKPSLTCKTADIEDDEDDILRKSVSIRSVNYTVEKIENNGTGISVIWLKT